MPEGVSAQPLLRIEAVEKTYGGRQGPVRAVAGASLAVRKGEFISLLGPSGCGKSTLLMMIAGLETPTAGRIELDGTLVAGPRRDIGIIFQDATLLPWKSALENILLPVRILRRPVREHRERARELLALVGLAGFENHKPGQLSGGMRQRVAICRALINDPEILLMDEPFSALDAITRDEMNELLIDLMERTAKTVVFVTHSIREAAFLSDRVLVMGGRPSGILLDETMPFAHPRRMEIGETLEFGHVVRRLRLAIEAAHAGKGG
ncbi:MAG: ABC transporter ATP-binding protein [Acetobacteraceae bacterium]|nr:ABC transporter ATP-binding protein [Acetobacteraceae bacterium]